MATISKPKEIVSWMSLSLSVHVNYLCGQITTESELTNILGRAIAETNLDVGMHFSCSVFLSFYQLKCLGVQF